MRAEPIAAIGLGCRFPGASSPEAYRELLRSGTDATSELPADRWDRARYHDPDPDAAGRTYVTRGGYIEDPAHFDADFFGIGPREAASLDPQQRLLLETTWRALESAGIPPSSLYGRKVGVFFGVSSSEYTHVLDRHVATSDIDAYFGTGNARSAAAGRVSYVLGLQGPSLVVDTACSSSLVAVHLAVQSLRMRECDVALVGGVNLLFTPEPTINFAKARMLSPDGRCKVFDRRADGFARGEGCGVVVLKRLGDAIADEDSTLAIVRGSAVNQDGASSGLTAPRGPSQVAVLRAALDAAGVLPEQVAYVEAHGTGTELGDPVELGALEDVFGGPSREDDPLLLGSTKANIGHLESAAGIAGFIKAVLALHHDELFSQIHFEEPTPKIDWASSGLEVVTRPRSFPAREGRKLAGVSSFGFSGTNAHVVLEAFDGRALAPAEPKPRHLLMISAKTEDALEAMAQQCAQALDDGEAAAALCRTAAVGRSQFGHRLAVSGRDVDALVAALRAPEKAPERTPARRGRVSTRRSPVVAFMFSGQGAQWTGMGAELYEREPAFAQAMSQCRDIMHDHVSDRVRALLEGRGAGDVEHTADAQPALFAYEYALGCVFRAWGVEPSFVIGHSLGEITAACFSGILGLEDAARLVIERGRCMADGSPSGTPSGQPTGTQPRGKMVALQADPEQIVALAQPRRDRLSIAAINGPQQVVVSGYEADVDEFVASVPHAAARPLSVSHAFHSPLMDGALAPFREVVGRLRFRTPNIPLVSKSRESWRAPRSLRPITGSGTYDEPFGSPMASTPCGAREPRSSWRWVRVPR
ncbi:MAG: type I polyketide synthase [Myxococcota bacterium]